MTKRKKIIFLITLILFILIDPVKYVQIPIKGDDGGLYVKGITGVHIHIPRDCGWLGCFGPDLGYLLSFRRVWWSDPTSFEVVHYGQSTGDMVARDRFSVFIATPDFSVMSMFNPIVTLHRFPEGDVKTLQSKDNFAYDKYFTYVDSFPHPHLDPNSLEIVMRMAKDNNGVYEIDTNPIKKIEFADVATFRFIPRQNTSSDVIGEDKYFEYAYGTQGFYVMIKDPSDNRKSLGCQYYRIGDKIYYEFHEVVGADPATFRVISAEPSKYFETSEPGYKYHCGPNPVVMDKNNRYKENRVLVD